jgi:predicted phosphate transport protein (TIGR00153 family)
MPNNSFLAVFAKSPLKPIEQHIVTVTKCSNLLIPFFEASFSGDWEAAEKVHKEIGVFEEDADKIKRELRMSLPGGIFMPMQRQDLLDLLKHQDQIANKAKDVCGLVFGRKMQVPQEIQADFTEYLKRCIDATVQASKAINELDELLETGFRGREVNLVEKMVNELDAIEDDTDKMQIKLRSKLHALEANLPPVDVMFLYKIIEGLGGLADIAERVGSRLELMLAK